MIRCPTGERIEIGAGHSPEVTAANLAIEMFLPADAERAARLRDLAKPLVPAEVIWPRSRHGRSSPACSIAPWA
jgi:hypothetical protein